MADAWDQFPDAAPAAAEDPWGAFPDAAPEVRAPGAAAAGIPFRGTKPIPANRGTAALGALKGAGELAATAVTGAAAKPISGVAGILSGGAALLSGRDPMEAGAETIRSVQEALTFQPGESAARLVQPVAETVAPVAKTVGDVTVSALETAGGPIARTAVPAVAEAVADVTPLGAALRPAKAATRIPGALKEVPPEAPKSIAQSAVERVAAPTATAAPTEVAPAATAARKVGYKLRPSDVQAAAPSARVPGKVAERFDNATELKRDIILENQKNTTRLAGDEFGLKATTRLGDAEFDKLKAPHFKTYNDVEKLAGSTPATPEFQQTFLAALERAKFKPTENPGITKVIGALRRRSVKNIQAKDVATQEAGYTDREIADALEEQFAKRLEAAGDKGAIERYREARQGLAKVFDVETATRAGQVDANALFKLQKKYGRLTGRLKIIADAAENFPQATKHSLSTAAVAADDSRSIAGMLKEGGAKALRAVPGLRSSLDVRSPGFQERFGPVATEAQATYFDEFGIEPQFAPPRDPSALGEQIGLSIGEPLQLDVPPGVIGPAPARPAVPELTNQGEIELFDAIMEQPPGRVGKPRSAKPRVRLKDK